MPLNDWDTSLTLVTTSTPCENYLLEKGCPEPTDEEYADFVEDEEKLLAEKNYHTNTHTLF